MKKSEMNIMKIWDRELGSMDKKVQMPLDNDNTKYMNLWISQRLNDKRGTLITTMRFGDSGLMMRFYGGKDRIRRAYATVPSTWDDIKNGNSGLMPLYDLEERMDAPYKTTIKNRFGEITFVFRNVYDYDDDDRSIEMRIGNTGKALRIYGKEDTLRQTEVSMPYEYAPTPEVETITL
jgi:hypothetical protein